MSRKRTYRQIIQDQGIGTVADKIGTHYETIRAIVYDGKNPGRKTMLKMIKFIRGITVDDFLEEIDNKFVPRVEREVFDPEKAKEAVK